ncbi:MAG TPA: hypothetical protein DCG90_10620 [Sphingobium sp.]|nr:hypothetical protein [Sphingobium sp. V4]WIW90152.1 hypothetical protein K3M67_19010 [Sphingobium sp. V4]HAF42200.1 hypothetical protein [Sphingobium sp.]
MSAPSLIVAYAEAQALLARLEERRRLSPVAFPLRTRMRIAERHALARWDKAPLHDSDIQVDGRGAVRTSDFDLSRGRQAVGAPIELDSILTDAEALLRWLGLVSDAGNPAKHGWQRSLADMLDAVRGWQATIASLPASPPLLHGAHLAQLWRERAPIGRGDLVFSLLIGDRWGPGRWEGSAGGLIALGLERSSEPWQRIKGEALERLWLGAIAAGAQGHLDLEIRLRSYAMRAGQFIRARRRPGRLADMLALAMAHPRVTSSGIAKALGLTSAGAIKLLAIAAEAGLLIERTGQSSYRSYAIPVAAPSDMPARPRRDPFALLDGAFPWDDDTDPPLAW